MSFVQTSMSIESGVEVEGTLLHLFPGQISSFAFLLTLPPCLLVQSPSRTKRFLLPFIWYAVSSALRAGPPSPAHFSYFLSLFRSCWKSKESFERRLTLDLCA